MTQVHIPSSIQTIVFDKDGTLIDFHAMWGGWMTTLGRRLEAAAYMKIAPQLFQAVGFDPATGAIAPAGPLAIATMAELRELAAGVLVAAGLTPASATAAIQAGWSIPDPVALARPLADLPALFGELRRRGAKIAVATTDDRGPTLATLAALGVGALVDAMACGDDGRPIKPAPDMILWLCKELAVEPADVAMVGDTPADMQMGRAAGVGFVVGVLSGVSQAEMLAPYADVVIGSVAELSGKG